MTADECHQRASACADNAGLAASEPVALEFMRMAAQWRAMAERTIFLGSVESSPVIRAVNARAVGANLFSQDAAAIPLFKR